jgi:hypothetical protein
MRWINCFDFSKLQVVSLYLSLFYEADITLPAVLFFIVACTQSTDSCLNTCKCYDKSRTAEFIHHAIAKAETKKAECLIIHLNTPGGLLKSTRNIVGDIMESSVPVVVYIAPAGADAGSAGVFITLSANIAAMAPGTNIGAAHPGYRG